MANHRTSKKHRTRKALLASTAAAGISGALVLGLVTDTAAVELASTVIGVGGRADPTSLRLQDKLKGNYALGFDGDMFTYDPIGYPASLAFQRSINVGAPRLADAIDAARAGDTRVVSYSEGTLVAEQVKRNLPAPIPGKPPLDFVFIASPYLPNGGIFARFPGFRIPGLLPTFGPAEPTAYDSTYVTNEYDGFADFPAYFNLLAIANATLGMIYAHPDPYYNAIDVDKLVEGQTKFTTVVPDNGAGGTDTYVLVYNPELPLLAPIRQASALFKLTALTEPVLDKIEPILRADIDKGYTDRTNADPDVPTRFRFVKPRPKPVEVAATTLQDATTTSANPTPAPNTESTTSGTTTPLRRVATHRARAAITHPTATSGGKVSRPGTKVHAKPRGKTGPSATTEPGSVPTPAGSSKTSGGEDAAA